MIFNQQVRDSNTMFSYLFNVPISDSAPFVRLSFHTVMIYCHRMRRKLIESASGNAPGDDDEI